MSSPKTTIRALVRLVRNHWKMLRPYDGEDQYADGHPGVAQRNRVQQLVHALVDGKHAADAEQDHRHQEGPEVNTLAKSQRVIDGWQFACLAEAEYQQQLVTGIRHRVDGLRQHGPRPRNHGRHTLGHGNGGVGKQGKQDGFEGISLTGHSKRAPAAGINH
jgi:hypothetical protein